MSRAQAFLAVLLPVLMGIGVFAMPTGESVSGPRRSVARDSASAPAKVSETTPSAEDEAMRLQVLGVWEDDYEGKRTMTLNADGTGTMVVELSGAKALLFASELRFDMEWSLAEGKLTKRTIGGEPSVKVNLILRTMGDTATEPVLEVTEERLVLLDKDGKTRYEWRRPAK
jgi:hypothetical protein